MLLLPDMNYQDLVMLMQVTENSLPLLSQSIRRFIKPSNKKSSFWGL